MHQQVLDATLQNFYHPITLKCMGHQEIQIKYSGFEGIELLKYDLTTFKDSKKLLKKYYL